MHLQKHTFSVSSDIYFHQPTFMLVLFLTLLHHFDTNHTHASLFFTLVIPHRKVSGHTPVYTHNL